MYKKYWHLITLLILLQLTACTSNISVQAPTTPTTTTTPTVRSAGSQSSLPPPTSQENQLAQQLFALINKDRAAQGLYPYASNSTLASGARLHSWKMASCGLTHACPNEPQPCQRVSNEGISWTSCGENVGYTSPVPTPGAAVQNIEQSMLNDPPPAGHRMNLLNTTFHSVGVGIYIDSKGLIWITEDFVS